MAAEKTLYTFDDLKSLYQGSVFLRKLLDSSPDGIVSADINGRILLFNRGAEQILGYDREEALAGVNAACLFPQNSFVEIVRRMQSGPQGEAKSLARQEMYCIAKNGVKIPVSLTGGIISNESGKDLAAFKVVLHNPAAVSLLDLKTESVVGQPVNQVIQNHEAVTMVSKVLNDLVAITREFEPGTISHLHLRACCAPVNTATGKIFGSVTVFEDITAKKQLEQIKSELVSMLAHELRAPLAAISQLIHATQDCTRKQRRNHFLNRMRERTQGLLQMIENLLSIARLESGSTVFTLEPIECDQVLASAIETIRPQAESRNLELTHLKSAEALWINVDFDPIRSVFINILDNAVKYTPPGGRIDITTQNQSGFALVQITDTGIGIPKEDLPQVFDQFYRVKNSATRGITGSGLGLPLAKRIIEAHQGTIQASSKPDAGSTFTVKLPLLDEPMKK